MAAAVAACTFIGRDKVEQCSSDADCRASPLAQKAGITAVCLESLCVEGPPPSDRIPCTLNADCAGIPEPSTCGPGYCVPILDPKVCPQFAGDGAGYKENDAVIVGVYMFNPAGSRARSALDLAARQLALKQPSPRLIPVLCGKGEVTGNAVAAIEHLRRIRAPVVIGEFETSELEKLLPTARGTGSSDPHSVAIWSTLPSHSSVQPPALTTDGLYAFLVDDMVRTQGGFQSVIDRAVERARDLVDAGAFSHRLIVGETPEAKALADALVGAGVNVDGVLLGSGGNRIDVAPLYEFKPDYRSLAAQLRDVRVIVGVGGDEIVKGVVSAVEATAGAQRPIYVVASRGKLNTTELTNMVATSPLVKPRLFGVDFGGDRDALGTFFKEAARFGAVPLAQSHDIYYDALHVAALASVAAARARGPSQSKLTASDMAGGLRALGDPNEPRITPTDYAQTINGLRSTGKASFAGTTGVWRFDDNLVRRGMGVSMFCFDRATTPTLNLYQDPSYDAGASDASCAPAR